MSLKLQCTLRRPGGSIVRVPPSFQPLHFKPVDPTRADSPHVADATEDQAQTLIALDPRTYKLFTPPAVAPGALQAPSLTSTPTPAPTARDSAAAMLAAEPDAASAIAATQPAPAFVVTPVEPAPVLDPVQEAEIDAAVDAFTRDSPPAPQVDEAAPATDKPTDSVDTASEIADAAGADGAMSVRDLKAAIAKGTLSVAALQALRAKELATETPRTSFVAEIDKALG